MHNGIVISSVDEPKQCDHGLIPRQAQLSFEERDSLGASVKSFSMAMWQDHLSTLVKG